MQSLNRSAARILNASRLRPKLALVLGSGFQTVLEQFSVDREIPYSQLPGFPPLTVPGHQPRLVIGRLEKVPLYIMCGRAHFYEGHSMPAITFPIRVLARCGIQSLLLTNAAGGIHPMFRRGDFMAIADHINLMGINPLRSEPGGNPPEFLDLSDVYDRELRQRLLRAGKKARVPLRTGIYIAVPGPTYETAAEIRAFAKLGADAVGMSTVPEAIVARSCGMKVAALSSITNLAAGRHRGPLSHAEVLAAAEEMRSKLGKLLTHFVAGFE